MFKSDLQHQFWLTKKIVQRKLGDKEDDCVKDSDARLDAKIELFRSLSVNGCKLLKIVELYLERVSILAANENALGKFLENISLCDGMTEKYTKVVGKSISYGSKSRELVKPPLTRLAHEVGTFNSHAVRDTIGTIDLMEKERTEYRASLGWLKSLSANLDPDSNRAIQKFRKTQQVVKQSKQKFEKYERDCLEKIDLLVAARCNMFSYVLINYQQALLKSFENTLEVFQSAIEFLKHDNSKSVAEFYERATKTENDTSNDDSSNRQLFFQQDFKDIDGNKIDDEKTIEEKSQEKEAAGVTEDLVLFDSFINDSANSTQNFGFLPSELLQWDSMETTAAGKPFEDDPLLKSLESTSNNQKSKPKQNKDGKAWYDIFAELDPLADFNNVNSVFNSGEAI